MLVKRIIFDSRILLTILETRPIISFESWQHCSPESSFQLSLIVELLILPTLVIFSREIFSKFFHFWKTKPHRSDLCRPKVRRVCRLVSEVKLGGEGGGGGEETNIFYPVPNRSIFPQRKRNLISRRTISKRRELSLQAGPR